MSALVASEIFRLFVNTLIPDEKVFPSLYADFLTTTSKAFISKRNGCFSILDCISEMSMKVRTFCKKRRVSYPNSYRNYCIRKRCLLKRLKGLSSALYLVINVLTGSKHCWSQHRSTIFLFFNEFEIIELENICLSHIWNLQTVCKHVDSRWQVFPSLYADFLTTTFKAFIAKRNGCFSIFYCISEICMKFRTFRKKRRVSQPNYYRNYWIRRRCLLKRLKGLASAHHSVINVLTGSKHCWSQHGTSIFLFLNEIEKNWVGKCLS